MKKDITYILMGSFWTKNRTVFVSEKKSSIFCPKQDKKKNITSILMGPFWTKNRTVFFFAVRKQLDYFSKEKMNKYIIIGPFWTKNGFS